MSWKRLAIRTAVATSILYAVAGVLAYIEIIPEFGEGIDVPPGTLRYTIGLWVDRNAYPGLCLLFWPAMLALALGVPESRPLLWIGSIVAGFGWALLWEIASNRLRRPSVSA